MTDSFQQTQSEIINIEKKEDVIIATLLAKEVSMFTLAELRATLNEAIANKPKMLILDLSRTKYMDSSGIALLFRLRHQILTYKGRFCITGLKGKLLVILDKVLQKDDIKFYDSVELACKNEFKKNL